MNMGEGATESEAFQKVQRDLAKENSVLAAMITQWQSMIGMALMFIITIGLGILIQPFFNDAELHAFGEEGTTEARWIGLELLFIFIFTAIIITLARWKKEWIIKYGIFAILWIALLYTTIPLAHLILVENVDAPQFEMDTTLAQNGTFITHMDDAFYLTYEINQANESNLSHEIVAYDSTSGLELWRNSEPGTFLSNNLKALTLQEEYITLTDGSNFWRVNHAGNLMEDSRECGPTLEWKAECFLGFYYFNEEVSDFGHQYVVTNDNRLIRMHLQPGNNATDGQWSMPLDLEIHKAPLISRVVNEDKVLMVSGTYATLFEIPWETSTPDHRGDPDQSSPYCCVTELWSVYPDEGDSFTAAEWGISPWSNENKGEHSGELMMLVLGTEKGDIRAWNVNTIGDSEDCVNKTNPESSCKGVEEDRIHLADNDAINGPVSALRLADYNDGGYMDLFAIDDGKLRMFSGKSLVERLNLDAGDDVDAILVTYPENMSADSVSSVSTRGQSSWNFGELQEEMLMEGGLVFDAEASAIGLIASLILMALLIFYPEWYIVNIVGILVGAGVITMLGISFVPWLVIIFMILAACYDYWAVYKSKHMLDLADTMIGLKLPILLVAPQEKGFSMLDEKKHRIRSADEKIDSESNKDKKVSSKAKTVKDTNIPIQQDQQPSGDAMFMGLGDVIFPGMLVLSAITFLTPQIGASSAFWVAMGTMVGGLVGYFILMTFVAMGRPQAGLPLLNGGAIMGYFIAGLIFAGTKAFEFNITF